MIDSQGNCRYVLYTITEKKMPVVNVHTVKENFDTILEKVQNSYEPVMIGGRGTYPAACSG
jgi:hypothetical protein